MFGKFRKLIQFIIVVNIFRDLVNDVQVELGSEVGNTNTVDIARRSELQKRGVAPFEWSLRDATGRGWGPLLGEPFPRARAH